MQKIVIDTNDCTFTLQQNQEKCQINKVVK